MIRSPDRGSDQADPSPRDGEAMGISLCPCEGRAFGMLCGPVGGDAFDHMGEFAHPVAHHGAARLEMELRAIGRAAKAKGLMRGRGGACQMGCAFGQGERVGMPLEDGECCGQVAQDGVRRGLLPQRDLAPAEFPRLAQSVFRAKTPREKLRAKADAEHGPPAFARIAHEPREGGKIGVGVVIRGRLFAAKDDQSVMGAEVGQAAIGPWFVQVDLGRRLVQGHAHLPVMGDAGVFDNRNAHM